MRAWLALVAGFVAVSALLVSSDASAVPSFGRQTGFACEACHTAFPELTPFGRRFKLNGYVLDNMQQVKTITAQNEEALLLNYIPPLSLMFQASYTRTKAALPDVTLPDGLAQNNQVLFPQQASLFLRGTHRSQLWWFHSNHLRLRQRLVRVRQHRSALCEPYEPGR
jgi:hypothetical protein